MSSAHAAAAYRAATDGPAQLVQKHIGLVSRVAGFMCSRLPENVEMDDLVQAGMVGLLEAARNYVPHQGTTFETFATHRVRGAIVDELRRGDWMPRSVHRHHRDAVAAMRQIEQKSGREATSQEVASALGMPLDEYHRLAEDAVRGQLISLEMHMDINEGEIKSSACSQSASTSFTRDAFRHSLAAAIETLPAREQMVVSLYYDQELTQREIGAVLDITESRVCQLHGQAMLRLRSRMKDWEIEDAIHPDRD